MPPGMPPVDPMTLLALLGQAGGAAPGMPPTGQDAAGSAAPAPAPAPSAPPVAQQPPQGGGLTPMFEIKGGKIRMDASTAMVQLCLQIIRILSSIADALGVPIPAHDLINPYPEVMSQISQGGDSGTQQSDQTSKSSSAEEQPRQRQSAANELADLLRRLKKLQETQR